MSARYPSNPNHSLLSRALRPQVALACHLRVASPKASLGLPEILIGLLPGAGGTQRLPRLVKAEMALGMITTGKMVRDAADMAVMVKHTESKASQATGGGLTQ